MKKTGTRVVKVSELKTNLFVRKELDWDHVAYLAELIASGVQMKGDIEVTDLNGVPNITVDGRHRKEAFEINGVKEVRVKILEFADEAEMISYAYRANTGGSKPPTTADTEHTVMLLLEKGEAKKRIAELLGLPAGLARRYIDQVVSRVKRQKEQRAAAAVTDGGLTVAKAAEQYEVPPERLKEVLSGHRRKIKTGVAEVQRNLTRTYKSLGSKHAALFRNLAEKYEDGDVTEKQVAAIFAHVEDLQKRAAHAVADWKKRSEAINGKATKVA